MAKPGFLRVAANRFRERAQEEKSRAMWQNFATALGLLMVAMILALYSSGAAREGRMASAGISAILALLLAIWVGFRFVPRLAANVEWDWLPFLSQYHVTREGWIYFGAIIIVVFAAINTNNNLLYMVLSALMAVLLLSGFLSNINFRWLKLTLRIPRHSFAGETFPISVELHNAKAIFPSLSLTVESTAETAFLFRPFYVACLRAQSDSAHNSEGMLHTRGIYRIQRMKVLSRWPFGFFLKSREYPVDAECICYPEILPQDQVNAGTSDILGSAQRFERGLGNDLYVIRDYLPSDSARHVHWKASAKTATLKTREFAAEESRRITIYFDRFGGTDQSQSFERLVSHAASLAVYWIRDGIEVSVVSDDWSSGYGNSEAHIETILGYLALVQPSTSSTSPLIHNGDGAMVLSLRSES